MDAQGKRQLDNMSRNLLLTAKANPAFYQYVSLAPAMPLPPR